MYKNIIFDFGNVLVEWHPERVYGEYFGDEAKAWWFLRHVTDRYSCRQDFLLLIRRLNTGHHFCESRLSASVRAYNSRDAAFLHRRTSRTLS